MESSGEKLLALKSFYVEPTNHNLVKHFVKQDFSGGTAVNKGGVLNWNTISI